MTDEKMEKFLKQIPGIFVFVFIRNAFVRVSRILPEGTFFPFGFSKSCFSTSIILEILDLCSIDVAWKIMIFKNLLLSDSLKNAHCFSVCQKIKNI